MAVGYPAEDPGQRPRKRFDRLYHYNQYGTPLAEDQDVRAELEQQKLIQPMDPLPGREEELKPHMQDVRFHRRHAGYAEGENPRDVRGGVSLLRRTSPGS